MVRELSTYFLAYVGGGVVLLLLVEAKEGAFEEGADIFAVDADADELFYD